MNSKSIKENFAQVLEQPDRIDFRDFIKENFGEQDYVDFKKLWSEPEKLAKHIIAFANSGGGIIIFGVEEIEGKVKAIGLSKLIDKADIKSRIAKFLPETLEYEILDFEYKESDYNNLKGKSFQILIIQNQDKHIPFLSKRDGSLIHRNRIYIRRGTESTEANYMDLQKLINRRIDLNISTSTEIEFEEHLAQLKSLFNEIKRKTYNYSLVPSKIFRSLLAEREEDVVINKHYPEEDYDQFISRMILLKKNIIEREVKK